MAFKHQWDAAKNYDNFSSSSYDFQYCKLKEYSITYLHRNQRFLCQALQSEGVWRFVDPDEPIIMSSMIQQAQTLHQRKCFGSEPDVERDLRPASDLAELFDQKKILLLLQNYQ